MEKNVSEVTHRSCFISLSCSEKSVTFFDQEVRKVNERNNKQKVNLSISLFVGKNDVFWAIVSYQRRLTAYVPESFIQTDSFEGSMVWD